MGTETMHEKSIGGLSEAQVEFTQQAAAAMAEEYVVKPEDFKVVRLDDAAAQAQEEAPKVLKEGDPGYDGIPHKEAPRTGSTRYSVAYSGTRSDLTNFHPENHESIMVGKWAFPVEVYPPEAPDGVASIRIPLDI